MAQVNLDYILEYDTHVMFHWRHKGEGWEDFWGWNSNYGRKGQSVQEVIEARLPAMGCKWDLVELKNFNILSNTQFDAVLRATSGD